MKIYMILLVCIRCLLADFENFELSNYSKFLTFFALETAILLQANNHKIPQIICTLTESERNCNFTKVN